MSSETVAGSTLGCTTDRAGTTYAFGTDAFTRIGEVTDIGAGYGRDYNGVAHAPTGPAQVVQRKGGYQLNAIDLQMAWDQGDAGQDMVRAAALTNAVLTFEVVKNGGDRRYFKAQVAEFTEDLGTVDGVVAGMLTLLPQTNPDERGYNDLWIRVLL